jgi:hypothetical protein
VVFSSWDVGKDERDFLTSEEPDTLSFEGGLFSINAIGSENVLSELVESLEVTVLEVAGKPKYFSFVSELFIVNIPERPSLFIDVFPKPFHLISSIGGVHESKFPINHVEFGFRKWVKGVLFFLSLGFIIIIIISGFFGSGGFLLFLFGSSWRGSLGFGFTLGFLLFFLFFFFFFRSGGNWSRCSNFADGECGFGESGGSYSSELVLQGWVGE